MAEETTKSPPDPDTPLESLFDQIPLSDETESRNQTTNKTRDADISSLIELNKLTGELTFKKRIDYEELVNKVYKRTRLRWSSCGVCRSISVLSLF